MIKKCKGNEMKSFKLYQINLTDEEVDIINAANDHGAVPKNKLRLDLTMPFGKIDPMLVKIGFSKGYFEHVSNITANSLEGVFEVGNIGPEENIERLAPMHSVSVGDVVEDMDGKRHVVASFGFEEII
jgi:hypothetical protein